MFVTLDRGAPRECPIDSARVDPGYHVLRAWPAAGRRFTAVSLKREVYVGGGVETKVDLSEARWVRIETDPFGATVLRGSAPLGETPITVVVCPGDPPLTIEREGYRMVFLTSESVLSGPSPRRVTLEPADRGAASTIVQTAGADKGGRSGWTTLLTGVTVVGSATAAVVFKKQADDAFDEYRTTGDPEEMRDLFDRAESLDSWSVASWIVSEVALGVLLYRLLHEEESERKVGSP